jgi:predicted membrane protein
MSPFVSLVPLAAESIAEEGRRIIAVMLVVGLIFLGVIALGQLARYLGHRRAARRAVRRRLY